MLDVEEQVRVMKGFDRRSEVDARDYLLAADVLRRIANAVLAHANANGASGVTCSPGSTRDPANANHEFPVAAFRLDDGSSARWCFMCAGRVLSESSKRDPENEWCIGCAISSVAYVPKVVADDMVRTLAERLALFVSKASS